MPKYVYHEYNLLGRLVSDDEIKALTGGRMAEAPTACGAPGVLFHRDWDDSYGVEELRCVGIYEFDADTEAPDELDESALIELEAAAS